MERNPGAWRKMAGLLILLALCILPCGAETSNRQRIIALDSEVYQTMKEKEREMFRDETASSLLNDMNNKRNRVEEILSSTDMKPEELAEASRQMEEAEKAMLADAKIQELKEARRQFQNMMDNVNKILRLVITGEVGDDDVTARGGCSGNCSQCGGCGEN